MNSVLDMDAPGAETPEQIISRAIAQYQPAYIFCMYSGGDDSLVANAVARAYLGEQISASVYIDTGIRLLEIADYVPTVCAQLGWHLLKYRAKDLGHDYEQLVLEHGFPGPFLHTKMFNRLKERALRALSNDHPGGNLLLISGLRRQESGRRMRLKLEPIQKDRRRIWCAPLFHWTNDEVRAYRAEHLASVPINPARQYLCMSGECLCGSFSRKGELELIEMFFPETGRYLRDLQRRVMARGFPWGWGAGGPPDWWSKMRLAESAGQTDAFEAEREGEVQMLCTSCHVRHEREVEARL
jgi:3'-phosphoadenosine 5'-phosphosulfate sulfotransferase (PAPS reductase)/FAD synthetase